MADHDLRFQARRLSAEGVHRLVPAGSRPRAPIAKAVPVALAAAMLAAASLLAQKRSAADTYLAYVDAVSNLKSITELKPFLPKAMTNMFGSMPMELQNELVKQARNDAVSRVRVVKESRFGGATILELSARRKDKPLKGWAKMIVEDGDFKVLKDDWSGAPAPAQPKIPASVSETGKAEGEFTVKGKTVPLKYAFARTFPDSSGQARIEVILPDAPWNSNDSNPMDRVKAGTLHFVKLSIGPDKAVTGAVLNHRELEKGFLGSAGGQHRFEPEKFGPDIISGRAYMEAPEEALGQTYYYAVTFKAAIEKPESPNK